MPLELTRRRKHYSKTWNSIYIRLHFSLYHLPSREVYLQAYETLLVLPVGTAVPFPVVASAARLDTHAVAVVYYPVLPYTHRVSTGSLLYRSALNHPNRHQIY